MGLYTFLFGTPPPPPNPKIELRKKMQTATSTLMQVIEEAKKQGYHVNLTLTQGAISLRMSEEIFTTKITNTQNTPNNARTKV